MEDIKMDLRRIEFHDVDWIHVAQNKYQWQILTNRILTIQVP
jgi:hypothetical protein